MNIQAATHDNLKNIQLACIKRRTAKFLKKYNEANGNNIVCQALYETLIASLLLLLIIYISPYIINQSINQSIRIFLSGLSNRYYC